MIGRTISHYRIRERIGGGGMGVVFRAEDTRLPGREVAIKLLNPELVADQNLRKRFLIEAQAASSLDHPNICQIYEVDETEEGRLFMSMAYYGGASLRHRLSDAPLDPLEAFQIAYAIAQGLACAHRKEIIHRDIKPANIMITDEGYVKIVDFGLAKLAGKTRITQSNTTLGTIAYMSPEQADGRDVDERADIWSLGVVLYEMVTGKLPFRGKIDQAMIYSILNEDHEPARKVNSRVPDDCSRIIDRCLEKNMARRYRSAEKLIEDLLDLARAHGWETAIAGTTSAPISGMFRRRHKKRAQRVMGLVAAVVVLAGAFGVWQWRANSGPPSPYVTEMRVAVLPVANLTSPRNDAFAIGLTVAASDILDIAAQDDGSMWVANPAHVIWRDPIQPSAAAGIFGVNRVVTGTLQRFQDHFRFGMELLDASTLDVVRTEAVEFEMSAESELLERLPGAVLALLELDDRSPATVSSQLPNSAAGIAYLRGVGEFSRRTYDNAVAQLRTVCATDSSAAAANAYLGWACWEAFGADSTEVATRHLRRAIRLDGELPLAHYYAGRLYEALHQPDSAAAAYQAALVARPEYSPAARRLSAMFRAQDRYDEAELVLQSVVLAAPDYAVNLRRLGLHYYFSDDYKRAVATFEASLNLAPDDGLTLNNLGVIHFEHGEWTRARELFERSFQLSPDCYVTTSVGTASFHEGRFRESADYFEYALQYCDSSDHWVWGNWGRSLYYIEGQGARKDSVIAVAVELAEAEYNGGAEDLIGELIDYHSMLADSARTFELIQAAKPAAEGDAELAFRISCAYELFGERNLALRYTGNALRLGYPLTIITTAPDLKDLILDTRFQAMTANTGDESERSQESGISN